MPSGEFNPQQDSGASFSRCGHYRYALWRTWDRTRPRLVFLCLNPSTADAVTDDPTLIRCMGYARDWGFGGVVTANLFAWRATDPRELRFAVDPIGPYNDRWLRRLTLTVPEVDLPRGGVPRVIAAWGNGGEYRGRANGVRQRIQGLHCLRLTSRDQPAHPLYLPKGLKPFPLPPPKFP